jgi:hypothetical protein
MKAEEKTIEKFDVVAGIRDRRPFPLVERVWAIIPQLGRTRQCCADVISQQIERQIHLLLRECSKIQVSRFFQECEYSHVRS